MTFGTTRSPQAIQILDRFHAKEHLSKVGTVIYRDSELGQKWIQRRYDELKVVIGSRLKRAGMQSLCAASSSADGYEDFWERRSHWPAA